ncbi:MAG: hypothetical protein P8R43_07840, partial [Planctomycetota bacterium]|nr:hypothetical protein [Planctomycetota bacterium]
APWVGKRDARQGLPVLVFLSGVVVLRGLLVRPDSSPLAGFELEGPIRILLGFLLLYPLAHLAVIVSSDLMDIEQAMTGSVLLNRYFVPFYFFSGLLLACAIGVGKSSARPLARKWRAPLGLGFIASVLCAAPMVRPSADLFGVGLRYAGTNFRSYAGLLSRTLLRDEGSGLVAVDEVEAKRLVEPFEGSMKADVLIGLGYVLSQVDLYGRDTGADAGPLGALVEPYPAEWHRWLARGIGAHSRSRLSAGSTSLEALVHPPGSAPEPLSSRYFEGLGIPVGYPLASRLATEWDLTERIAEAIRPERRAAVWSGFGWDLARRSERGIAAEQRTIEARKTLMLPVDRSALTCLEFEQP